MPRCQNHHHVIRSQRHVIAQLESQLRRNQRTVDRLSSVIKNILNQSIELTRLQCKEFANYCCDVATTSEWPIEQDVTDDESTISE